VTELRGSKSTNYCIVANGIGKPWEERYPTPLPRPIARFHGRPAGFPVGYRDFMGSFRIEPETKIKVKA
jgi:hypothetical protein